LDEPGDCKWPDARYLASAALNVNSVAKDFAGAWFAELSLTPLESRYLVD
jgi:hypothetical protein